MKPTTIQQKAKRRKVLRKKMKKEMGTSSSSEDEKKIKYMDSDADADAEPDVLLVEAMEIPQKDYVQTDMKKWIPANANLLVVSQETLRTVWVRLPTDEEELQYATKESEFGRSRSEKSKCSKVRPVLVRNTVLNRFGNIERTYVGMNPVVLQSQVRCFLSSFSFLVRSVQMNMFCPFYL